MKKLAFIIVALLTMICTVSCETVGKGTSIDTVTGYETES
jgi:hypothetical protein